MLFSTETIRALPSRTSKSVAEHVQRDNNEEQNMRRYCYGIKTA